MSRAPSIRRCRKDGWIAERRALFLATLRRTGDVKRAAGDAAMSRETAYRLRRRDRDFRADWNAAMAHQPVALPPPPSTALECAIHGTPRAIVYHGKCVAIGRRYDNRAAFKLLKLLDARTRNGHTFS